MKKAYLFFCLLTAHPIFLHAVDLVKNGQAVAEIVLPVNASPSVKTAGEEIQRHLESMSGAKLNIVTAPTAGVENQIFVGQSEETKKLGISVDDIKYDGFKIVAKKNYVAVVGREIYHSAASFRDFIPQDRNAQQANWELFTGHKWRCPPIYDTRDFNKALGFHLWDGTGTLYGAYDLLGQLGMRWYSPIPDIGLVIPKLKDISIREQSIKREPEFPIRIMANGSGRYKDECLWYKSMGVGEAFFYPIYHSVSGPTKINPEQQPQEYYGIVGGKIDYEAPKFSNERLRADTVEYLNFVEKAFPNIDYACIGQPDGWSALDSGDAAAGWDKLAERGKEGRFSDYAWDFVEDVSARFLKLHPNKKFTFMAYDATRRPPSQLKMLPENMSVIFCQHAANGMFPSAAIELEDRAEWQSKMTDKSQLLIYEYYVDHAPPYNFPPVPVVWTDMMQKSFKPLYDHIVGFYAEVAWSKSEEETQNKISLRRPGISHLMTYLHNRLCWDRNLDIQAVLNEYYDLYFGPAKAEMKEFYTFAESVWMRPEARQITAAGGFLKPEDVDRYEEILNRAKAKAGDSIYGKRIASISEEMKPLKLLFEKLKRTGPNIQIQTSTDTPVIDGDLDKPFWRKLQYTFLPLKDIFTGEVPQHVETLVSFRWMNDNSSLIVGIECKEPKMQKLVESCKDADSLGIYKDDNVEIALETASGIRPLIVINSAGVVLDECITQRLEDLPNFYKVTKVAVKKYADRWTAEVQIDAKPISGERPTPFLPWGANISRQRMAGSAPEYFMLSPSGTNFKDLKCMANIFVRK
ncbi:MAG: DUF4838 domain-containing protein [Verrucomicrobia bacterium]|nr:DUF4838 domain-containing protein [Verrucomicrobiota bacterium]